jgi:excisionase family DNA binding protein
MTTPALLGPVASDRDAELATVAQRCLMAALDHSRAPRIALVDQDGAITDALVLELPPMALRLFAVMFGMVAEQRPVMLVQQNHQLTIQEAAAFLNVSRPFVIKEVEAGRLKCCKIGRHRRIEFTELRRYQGAQRLKSERALQELADLSQDLRLGY